MKVIFLDIDGVLNTSQATEGDVFTKHGLLNKTLVSRLNHLISVTGAEVVISSSWRILCTQEEILEALRSVGYQYDIHSMTGRTNHGFRGLEILEWCRAHNPKRFVILDDDSDFTLCQGPFFFNTDCAYGLTEKIVYKAARLLNDVRWGNNPNQPLTSREDY